MSIRIPQRFFPNAISIFWLCSKNLNVPGVTKPALIDLYMWKVTSIHHRWRISFFLKLSRRGTAVLPLAHICRQPTTWDLQGSQGYVQPEKKGLCRRHFSLTLPLYPQWFLLLTDCQNPHPDSLFHFCGLLSNHIFTLSSGWLFQLLLCSLLAALLSRWSIGERWELRNKIFCSFFLKGK